jgi:hypothetical protein
MPFAKFHVAYSEMTGVFLGVKDGVPIWSKVNKKTLTGEERAPLFEDEQQFHEFIQPKLSEYQRVAWDNGGQGGGIKSKMKMVEVYTGGGQDAGATVDDCIQANLPRWGQPKEESTPDPRTSST